MLFENILFWRLWCFQVDSPIPPGERGLRNFLSDIDDDLVQQHRQQLFNVNKNSIASAIDR